MYIVFIFSKEFLNLSKSFSMEMAHWDCAWYEGIICEGYYKESMDHVRGKAANWAFPIEAGSYKGDFQRFMLE